MSMIRSFFIGLNFEEFDLPDCLKPELESLVQHLEAVSLPAAFTKKTKAFKEALKAYAGAARNSTTITVEERFRISPAGPSDKSPFRADLRVVCNKSCSVRHALVVELCLNNVIAVGTHFLKIETTGHYSEAECYGILICLTREFLNAGNWDPAYADDLDYVQAYELAYKPVLSQKMAVLQLRKG
jgi:hypothetical protein